MKWLRPKPGDLFTPSTKDVRGVWTSFGLEGPSFDRWLVAHDVEVRRAALEEAARAVVSLNAEETPRLEH